ncbi:MAG TPA: FAD-dependent oxidoreductase [Candidatus Angelobacter sp.]
MKRTYDFAVIGAGVFGAWTARYLRQAGASVVILDAYGPGNSRSSSGGETRIIRAGYGPDELYTRWAIRSFPLWQEFFERVGRDFFRRTGVLWLGDEADPHVSQIPALLARLGVQCEKLSAAEISRRYPQLHFAEVTLGVLEPQSGVLLARDAVQALVMELAADGVEYLTAAVQPPRGRGKLLALETKATKATEAAEATRATGAGQRSVSAGTFIFTCGSWLPKLFPELLGELIFATRQEVFFLGPPAGSDAFHAPRMPAWLHHTHPDRPYALPDIENRGFKIALDRHGPEFDPDHGSRVVSAAAADHVRGYLAQHVPALAHAPVVETRVCQYENTWNGDFLLDRHPDFDNVWLAGGGSGHGFKHGPVVGEYLSARILNNAAAEPRFSLASKQTRKARSVY